MDKVQTERQLRDVFAKTSALTADDLNVIRAKAAMMPTLTGSLESAVMARLEVELIDAIRRLDATSVRLITKTNALTRKILYLTIVGVVLAFVGIAVALAPLLRR
jgi:hypothetical protein